MEGAFAQKHTAILDAAGTLLKSGYHDFKSDYTALRHMIKTENISAAVCGFATAPGCFEAARDSNIPYILTSSYAAFPGKRNRRRKLCLNSYLFLTRRCFSCLY